MGVKRWISVVFIFLGCLAIQAQKNPVEKEHKRILRKVRKEERKQLWKEKDLNLLVLPVVYYSPETRLAGGVSGVFLFKSRLDSLTTRSMVSSNAIYTFNDQIIIYNPFQVYTGRNRYFFNGEISFYRYPYVFAGIGNQHEVDDDTELYTASYPRIDVSAYRKIKNNWYGGLNLWYQDFKITEVEKNGWLDQNLVPGSRGGKTLGAGFSFLFDSRDFVTSPTQGWFASVAHTHFSEAFASDFSYDNYQVDIRKYIDLGKNHVLAAQVLTDINLGEVPFDRLAMLGGERLMRGYQRGIFRDKIFAGWQVEYRSKPFFDFLAVTAFVSNGAVGTNSEQLGNHLRWSYGGGLRVLVNKEKRLFIRFDTGFGPKTSGFYFNIGEAF